MWLDRFRSSRRPALIVGTPICYKARSERFELDNPVCFAGDGCKQDGWCVNVSDSGLLAIFAKPPELWTDGQLSFVSGKHYFSINARVARLQDSNVGFAFSANTNDRAALSILMGSVSDRPLTGEDWDSPSESVLKH